MGKGSLLRAGERLLKEKGPLKRIVIALTVIDLTSGEHFLREASIVTCTTC